MTSDAAGTPPERDEWARRFTQQAASCRELGSALYARLLELVAAEIHAGTATWDLLRRSGHLRFGQAAPLRLLGAAHRLALTGGAPDWAEVLPSCGGSVPASDEALLVSWRTLVDLHTEALGAGLEREVQTNEVARAPALALAVAEARMRETRLVELGCSAGLNLRLDHFEMDLGGVVLGTSGSAVQLRPEMRRGLGGLRHSGLVLPVVSERVGIDPHPVDPTNPEGAATIRSFIWPDQLDRLERIDAAIGIARSHPAELLRCGTGVGPGTGDGGAPGAESGTSEPPDAAAVLDSVLDRGGPAVVMHSIVWQYVPPETRWAITRTIEEHGESASATAPLVWVRFEPDQWDRRRAAVWVRSFPSGSDRLAAHVDYHGRWVEPL
ncbi:MAG: DUF2332 domain-containing protein [Microthrixaceae bacterium]|nr:DUF2332 domain-containing protein [Microthrixaceae bacterium]